MDFVVSVSVPTKSLWAPLQGLWPSFLRIRVRNYGENVACQRIGLLVVMCVAAEETCIEHHTDRFSAFEACPVLGEPLTKAQNAH